MNRNPARFLSTATYVFSTILGISALLYPFFLPSMITPATTAPAYGIETSLSISVLLVICLLAIVFEVQSQTSNNRLIALLGVLVAINAVLRFVEVSIPGPGGFSPIFFLIILTGYVFGGGLGFLMGVLTLLVSALITGGVGPWLPGQMITAGWVGMSAAILRKLMVALKLDQRPIEIIVLALFGIAWGLLYGVIMNLWSWPFIVGPSDQYWNLGISLGETARRYATYYLVTSFMWDLVASAGNAVLLLAFGAPTLRALRRFQKRFIYHYSPVVNQPAPGAASPESEGSV